MQLLSSAFGTESLTESGAHNLTRLAVSPALRIFVSPAPQNKNYGCIAPCQLLCGYCGLNSGSWAYVTNTLPTELSPQFYPVTLMKINFSLQKKAGRWNVTIKTLWDVFRISTSTSQHLCCSESCWKLIKRWFLKYSIYLVWVSVSVDGHVCVIPWMGVQRTACWSWFRPSTTWITGIRLRTSTCTSWTINIDLIT